MFYERKKPKKHPKKKRSEVIYCPCKSIKIEIVNNSSPPKPAPVPPPPSLTPQNSNIHWETQPTSINLPSQGVEDIKSGVNVITSVLTDLKADLGDLMSMLAEIKSDVENIKSIVINPAED